MLNTLSLFALDKLPCTGGNFFGLVPWYHYLTTNCSKDGSIETFQVLPGTGTPSDIPLVLLAIVDDLMRISALVAIGFIIYGAIQYIASQGSPDATSKAKSTVLNALIGLVIAVSAVVVVSFIGASV